MNRRSRIEDRRSKIVNRGLSPSSILDHRSSLFTRTLSLALVAAMVLTMPGATAWADTILSPSNDSNQNVSSNRVTVISDQTPDRSYKRVLNPKVASALQIPDALLEFAGNTVGE